MCNTEARWSEYANLAGNFAEVETDEVRRGARPRARLSDPRRLPAVGGFKGWVEKNLKRQPQLTASVEDVTLTGLYWLPLFKHGSSKYRVHLQVVGKDTLVYTGVLEGVTDFDYSGLCSVRTLKQSLGEQIASKVVKSVDDVIRK